MREDDALRMIEEALKEGLEKRGCKRVTVKVLSRGELEVEFEKDGEWFEFYFG